MVRLIIEEGLYKTLPKERQEACDCIYNNGRCENCEFMETNYICEDEEGCYIDEWNVCRIDDDEWWNDAIREEGERFWEKK